MFCFLKKLNVRNFKLFDKSIRLPTIMDNGYTVRDTPRAC